MFRKLSNLLSDNLNLSVITGSKAVIPTHSLMCTLPFPPNCLRSHKFFSKDWGQGENPVYYAFLYYRVR